MKAASPSPPIVARDQSAASDPLVLTLSGVIALLAKRREHFEQQLRTKDSATSPVGVLRRAPILELDEARYLILYDDFILSQADEGPWYGILDGIRNEKLGAASDKKRGRYFEALGWAVEEYAWRVLSRCALLAGPEKTDLARVARRSNSVKRCDFLLRYGDFLCVIEVKRVGLSASHLDGGDEMILRLAEELGEACRQILETYSALQRNVCDCIPDLVLPHPLPRGLPIIVTQRPTFAWFSTRTEIVPEDIRNDWFEAFGIPPTVWSLSELELIEAATSGHALPALLEGISVDSPIASAGLAEQLAYFSMSGPTVAPYFFRKSQAIWSDGPGASCGSE